MVKDDVMANYRTLEALESIINMDSVLKGYAESARLTNDLEMMQNGWFILDFMDSVVGAENQIITALSGQIGMTEQEIRLMENKAKEDFKRSYSYSCSAGNIIGQIVDLEERFYLLGKYKSGRAFINNTAYWYNEHYKAPLEKLYNALDGYSYPF